MPTLRELEANLVKLTSPNGSMRYVETLAEADGLMFLCPKCFAENKGSVGTHSVLCWFVGRVPDTLDPKPGRWTPQGTGLDDLTFVPGAPPRAVSVKLTSGCMWHGFVKQGAAA